MAQSRVAGHAQQVELADDIAEDDCAIAGHSDTHYSLSFGPLRSAEWLSSGGGAWGISSLRAPFLV
ncbi:MAG: hypothetical protein WA711_14740, partial [Pseudolabrys sp.]